MLQMARRKHLWCLLAAFLKTLSQIYVHWDVFQHPVSSSTHMLLSDVTVPPPAAPQCESRHLCSDLTFQLLLSIPALLSLFFRKMVKLEGGNSH